MASTPLNLAVHRPRFGRRGGTGVSPVKLKRIYVPPSYTRVEGPGISARLSVQTCHPSVPQRVPDRAPCVIMWPSGGLRVAGRMERRRQRWIGSCPY